MPSAFDPSDRGWSSASSCRSRRGEAPIRVLIVDDHRLFADAIRATVIDMGMSVLGIYATAEGGLAGAREHRPDMVLLDLGLPDRSGLELGREILEELPETKVVALTALDDEQIGAGGASRRGSTATSRSRRKPSGSAQALRSVEDGQTVFPQRKIGRHRGSGRGRAPGRAADHPRGRGAAAPHRGRIQRPDGRRTQRLAEHRPHTRPRDPVASCRSILGSRPPRSPYAMAW